MNVGHGGLYAPETNYEVAVRSAIVDLRMRRDIVALAIGSYGGDTLDETCRRECAQMIATAVTDESSRKASRVVTLSDLRAESMHHAESALAKLEELKRMRAERVDLELVFSGLEDSAELLHDVDMNGSLEDTLLELERGPENHLQREPHTPLRDRASPTIAHQAAKERNYEKMIRARDHAKAFEHEQKHLQDLQRVHTSHDERVRFFENLARALSDSPKHRLDDDNFALVFMYGFAYFREVQRSVCAEYCNTRPRGTRQLHPSRHFSFVACLPALFEHYFRGRVSRLNLVPLARHLHSFGFVPLLGDDDVLAACAAPVNLPEPSCP